MRILGRFYESDQKKIEKKNIYTLLLDFGKRYASPHGWKM
jgi:hypothetical protein